MGANWSRKPGRLTTGGSTPPPSAKHDPDRVAIVGSRNFGRLKLVEEYVDFLPLDAVVISGGAPGVDTVAANRARARGMAVEVYKADWKTHGKAAGMIRNSELERVSRRCVAFWDGESPGTKDTIDKFRFAGKPFEIVLIVDGQVVVGRS